MRTSAYLTILLVVCAIAGCGKKGGQDEKPIPRPDLRIQSQNNLQNIGKAYVQEAQLGQPPGEAKDLGLPDQVLKSPKDKEPYEIVWGVDLNRLQDRSKLLLAWEKTPDKEGGRCVLFADGNPGYLSEAEFQQAKKAKGK